MRVEKVVVGCEFGEEYAGTYTFAEISWAKRSRIIQKYTKYHPVSGEVVSSDFVSIQAETVMASLHGQPESHPITLERLLAEENGVPIGLGELFSQVANRLNSVDREESRFLSVASGGEGLTGQSQSSGLVKNSGGLQGKLSGSLPG